MPAETVSLQTLVESIPHLAWTARADGFIDLYNQRWYDYTGKAPDEVEGWGWRSVHHPENLAAVTREWEHSLRTGEPFEMELPLRRADGVFRWFLVRAAPLKGEDGAVRRWFGTSTDVNDLHELRERFAHARDVERRARAESEVGLTRVDTLREDALRAVRAREDLLAIVSHELRNPLSTVLLGARAIGKLADGSEPGLGIRRAATGIVKAVGRMDRLIGDLLDLTKLEQGQPLPIEVEEQDAVGVVREAAELFEPIARGRQLRLETHLPDAIRVPCDGERVHQAVSNLLGNAVKFTCEGGVVQVGARGLEREVLVTVADSGVGIPADHVPHIFEPYWQSDPVRKRGVGLGLSIVKAIVEAHGGRIWVESTPAVGSTFFFTLPMAGSSGSPQGERAPELSTTRVP